MAETVEVNTWYLIMVTAVRFRPPPLNSKYQAWTRRVQRYRVAMLTVILYREMVDRQFMTWGTNSGGGSRKRKILSSPRLSSYS